MTTLNHRRKQKQQESVKVDAYEQHISKIRSDLEVRHFFFLQRTTNNVLRSLLNKLVRSAQRVL